MEGLPIITCFKLRFLNDAFQAQILNDAKTNQNPPTIYVLVMPDNTRMSFNTLDSKEMETLLSVLPSGSVLHCNFDKRLPSVPSAKLEALKAGCQKKGVSFIESNGGNGLAAEPSTRYYIHVFSGWMGVGTNTPPTSVIPPDLILSTNINLGENFVKQWELGGPPLSGYIEAHGGKYFLHTHTEGNWGVDYIGEIELEKPFVPASKPMHDADNYDFYFVLSTNSNYKPFLENLRADKIFR